MVLNTTEATEFLGCKKTTMYRMLKRGSLDGTYYTVGSKRLFLKEKLKEWQASGGEKQNEQFNAI